MDTNFILQTMKVIFWVIFIGLCIEAGAKLTSFIVTLYANPEAASHLYMGLNLSELYDYNKGHFIGFSSFIIAIAIMKAYLAYLVVKMFLKLDFEHPFTSQTVTLVSKISNFALELGIVTLVANIYSQSLEKSGVPIPEIEWGTAEILFMAGIIFVISLIFKKGIEIQSENELTI